MSSCAELSVSCYEGETPAFVARELDRLYGARYSSLAHFQIYGLAGQASTYVVRTQGEATTLYVYRRRKRQVCVLNEGIRVGRDEAVRFASHMFDIDKGVSAVAFNFVQTEDGDFSFPHQREVCAFDTVLALPATLEQYMESLGSSTRSTIKYRLNKIKREFPSFKFQVFERDEVDERQLRDIVRMNRARMSRLDKVSAIDAQEERRIISYVRECGFVGIATIDGRLCAGAVTYRLGRNFAARVLAHDPAYDQYRLGFVSAFLTIGECIRQGGSEFCFGWGEGEYKTHLGATQRQLSHLVIYRSRWHALLNLGMVVRTAVAGFLFRARQSMREASRRGDRIGAIAVNGARALRQWLAGLRLKRRVD
jgi:hypothetical protein